MIKKYLLVLFVFSFKFNFLFASNVPLNIHRPSFSVDKGQMNLKSLDVLLKTEWKKNVDFSSLSHQTLNFGPKAVPVLLNAMKKKSYPVQNRWIAMFSLTKLMGKNSSKVLSKFTKHPDWMMRLGALKCLLFLKEKSYAKDYALLLTDKSLVVRQQALKNIHQLNIKENAKDVSNLLAEINFDKTASDDPVVDMTLLTLAKLGHKQSIPTLVDMLKAERFKKNSATIDFSLEQLTGKKSPNGDLNSKIAFWSRNSTSI